MGRLNAVNSYSTTLNGAITNSDLSLVVNDSPPTDLNVPFRCRIQAEGSNTDEIITITAVSGTGNKTWTILRATESWNGSTSASAHANTAVVKLNFTAGTLFDVYLPPRIIQAVTAGNATTSVTITAAASGNMLAMVTNATTGQITSPSCTNVSWTQVKTLTSGGSSFYALWIGLVSGGSSGTTITMTKPGSFNSVAVIEIVDTVTPTLGQNTTISSLAAASFGVTNFAKITSTTRGRLLIACSGQDNTTGSGAIYPAFPCGGIQAAQAVQIVAGYAVDTTSTLQATTTLVGGLIFAEID